MQESFGSYTGLYIVLLTLTTTVILLRTYVRVRITKIWQLQDWMLVLAQCGLIATLVLCSAIVQIHERPGETFRQSQDAIIKLLFYTIEVYAASALAFKICAWIFYIRLVQSPRQKHVFVVLTVLYFLVHAVVFVLCNVRCGRWDPVAIMVSDNCPIGWTVVGPIFYVGQALNVFINIACGVVPAWLMIRQRTGGPAPPPGKAWPLIILAVTYNAVSLSRLAFVKDLRFGPNNHQHAAILLTLSVTKLSLGIFAASLGAMQPLVGPALRAVIDWVHHMRARWLPNFARPANGTMDVNAVVTHQTGPIVLHTALLRSIGLLPNSVRSKDDGVFTEDSTSTLQISGVADKSGSRVGTHAAKENDKNAIQSISEVGDEVDELPTETKINQQSQ